MTKEHEQKQLGEEKSLFLLTSFGFPPREVRARPEVSKS